MKLTNISVIRELMSRHGISFDKALGQNFLINPVVCPQIAELGGASGEVNVLEIGPGVGVLTSELAKRAKKVVAIELDKGLLPVLKETLADFDNVEIIHGDVLKLDLAEILRSRFGGGKVIVCANLPYYITSPALMRLLEEKLSFSSITVMVQKEAAKRMCAPLPSRGAGAITAAISYYAKPQILFEVSRGSFYPAPNVDSAVIKLDLYDSPPVAVADEQMLFRVIKAAFSQRRKILLNCIASGMECAKDTAREVLERAEVPTGARAEQLTLEQFARIADACGECAERLGQRDAG